MKDMMGLYLIERNRVSLFPDILSHTVDSI